MNASVDDGSKIADLMKYFVTADPNDKRQGELSERVNFLKCEEGGHELMCEVTERFIEMGIEQGIEFGIECGIEQSKIKIAKVSIKKGLPIDVIAEITGLTIEEVKELNDTEE